MKLKEKHDIDQQKCAQKYLRELKTISRNTIESRLDLQYDKIKQYEQRFNEFSIMRNEFVEFFLK